MVRLGRRWRPGLSTIAAPALGHEIGTTHVTATLDARGEYVIDLWTDAAALLARLEATAGRSRSGTLTGPAYAQRIQLLQQELLRHGHVTFDGHAVAPHHIRAAAVAPRPRLRVRAAARNGVRGCAARSRPSSIGAADRLLTFNAGVEAGQLTVIAIAILLVAHWSGDRGTYRRRVAVPGSALIALAGLYWTVERLQIW